MKLTFAQINPIIGDLTYNLSLHQEMCKKAVQESSQLIVFPELSLCGYPPQDLLTYPHFIHACQTTLRQLVDDSKQWPELSIIVGCPIEEDGQLYNSAVVIANGYVVSRYNKRCLPTYDVFDEHRYFLPGKSTTYVVVEGKKVGLSICEDIWELDPIELVDSDCDVLVNISASPFEVGKLERRLAKCQAIAKSLKIPLVMVNQVGGNDHLVFDGGSMWINAHGLIKSLALCFKQDLVHRDIFQELVTISPTINPTNMLENALILGLKDYVKKCGFKQVLLGLSGGIDSAVTCVLAVEALGADKVLGVLMPSEYSSEGSITDSEALAKNLGIAYETLPISNCNKAVLSALDPIFKQTSPDVTEENIQARLRGMLLMAIANKQNRLLLTTGNKSEMAVGYSTLYGDMNGGLGVLADVTKTQVYALASYINQRKPRIPIEILEKPPSAELRPNQVDQDTLPPYDILDAIIMAHVEEKQSINQIIQQGFDKEMVTWVVNAIHRNEYKRQQSAITLKVTGTSFGSGRRFPIAANPKY